MIEGCIKMNPQLMNKLVNERITKCKEGHLYVDTYRGIANGYTTAGKLHSSILSKPTQKDKEIIKSPNTTSDSADIPSGFSDVLKQCGVDEV